MKRKDRKGMGEGRTKKKERRNEETKKEERKRKKGKKETRNEQQVMFRYVLNTCNPGGCPLTYCYISEKPQRYLLLLDLPRQ